MKETVQTRTLTCIICPRGCNITAEFLDKQVFSIDGNLCQRGKKYAEDEIICPRRTLTSTVKSEDGGRVAVKTREAIDKKDLMNCMDMINDVTISLPVRIGDIILKNVFGTDVVATQNRG